METFSSVLWVEVAVTYCTFPHVFKIFNSIFSLGESSLQGGISLNVIIYFDTDYIYQVCHVLDRPPLLAVIPSDIQPLNVYTIL